jgi:phage shock protein A
MADANKVGVVPQELTDTIARLNAGVAAAAQKIQSLKDQISQSMTQQEVADVQSQLDAIATSLEGLSTEQTQAKKK